MEKRGTCQICGGHDRKLYMLAVADFFVWACEICVRQLRECQVRRYCGTCEETEPGE